MSIKKQSGFVELALLLFVGVSSLVMGFVGGTEHAQREAKNQDQAQAQVCVAKAPNECRGE